MHSLDNDSHMISVPRKNSSVLNMKLLDCTVVGDIFIDLVIHVGRKWSQLNYGGTSYSDFAKIEFGGSGNVAVGLSLLGAKVSLVGKAGNDLFGKLYVENLNIKS